MNNLEEKSFKLKIFDIIDIVHEVSKVSLQKRKKGSVIVVRGRVKWFNNEKGYGFIEFTDKEDIFVHYSAINQEGYKTLQEGQYVEFNLLETSKGYQALNVTVVKSEIIA